MTCGRRAAVWSVLAAAAAGASPAAVAQVTQPGRYDAQFCVANPASQPPNCGAAEFTVQAPGRASLRISDIVYRFRLRSSQLDVTTLHGAVQIDEFSADYVWKDGALVFADADKDVRYEIRPSARPR